MLTFTDESLEQYPELLALIADKQYLEGHVETFMLNPTYNLSTDKKPDVKKKLSLMEVAAVLGLDSHVKVLAALPDFVKCHEKACSNAFWLAVLTNQASVMKVLDDVLPESLLTEKIRSRDFTLYQQAIKRKADETLLELLTYPDCFEYEWNQVKSNTSKNIEKFIAQFVPLFIDKQSQLSVYDKKPLAKRELRLLNLVFEYLIKTLGDSQYKDNVKPLENNSYEGKLRLIAMLLSMPDFKAVLQKNEKMAAEILSRDDVNALFHSPFSSARVNANVQSIFNCPFTYESVSHYPALIDFIYHRPQRQKNDFKEAHEPEFMLAFKKHPYSSVKLSIIEISAILGREERVKSILQNSGSILFHHARIEEAYKWAFKYAHVNILILIQQSLSSASMGMPLLHDTKAFFHLLAAYGTEEIIAHLNGLFDEEDISACIEGNAVTLLRSAIDQNNLIAFKYIANRLSDKQLHDLLSKNNCQLYFNAIFTTNVPFLKSIEAYLTADETSSIIIVAYDSVVVENKIQVLLHFDSILTKEKRENRIKGEFDEYWLFESALSAGAKDTALYLLSYPDCFKYHEKHKTDDVFIERFIDSHLEALSSQKKCFTADYPDKTFDLSPKDARLSFYMLRNLIRRYQYLGKDQSYDGALFVKIELLLTLPAINRLINQHFDAELTALLATADESGSLDMQTLTGGYYHKLPLNPQKAQNITGRFFEPKKPPVSIVISDKTIEHLPCAFQGFSIE
jgi:hypothetical protein